MKDKKYKARIILNGKIVYEGEVYGWDEGSAREFIYERFEQESYAEVEPIDEPAIQNRATAR